jgi:putative membrane protein
MDTHELAPARFWQNRPLQVMALVYVAFWVAMAVAPVYPYDWWIENILVFATAMAVVGTYRWFRFSNLTYFLLLIFMMLHTYSAHYAYTQVPLPWLNELFGRSDRLNFDRFVHLLFGVLLAYPIWELLRRTAGVRRGWAYLITIMAVLAAGAFYELLEMWIALVLAPEIGDAFVGTQGDIWDAQKDIALALYGSVGALLVTFLVRRIRS